MNEPLAKARFEHSARVKSKSFIMSPIVRDKFNRGFFTSLAVLSDASFPHLLGFGEG